MTVSSVAADAVSDSERLQAVDKAIAGLETERRASSSERTEAVRLGVGILWRDQWRRWTGARSTTSPDRGDEMSNALDMFREQQDAARQVHAQLVEVAALLEHLQAQISGLANDRDLREVLREERSWLEAAERAIADARRWRDRGSNDGIGPAIAYRWITALAFALLSAVAVGTGYGWIAKPYATELDALRPHAELGLSSSSG